MNATNNEFLLTADGISTLKGELDTLLVKKRPEIAARLKEAKDDGDLSENAMYDAARDEQSFVEGRIAEIEHILKHAKLIESKGGAAVSLGSTVHLSLEDGEQHYTIVGSTEANPDKGMISDQSPLGRALLGRKPGEAVEISVPSGKMTYKIVKIS